MGVHPYIAVPDRLAESQSDLLSAITTLLTAGGCSIKLMCVSESVFRFQ